MFDDGCVCVWFFRRQKATDSAGSDEEDVDELALIDHKEIMSRITLKQEVRGQLFEACVLFLEIHRQQKCAAAPAYKARFILLVLLRVKGRRESFRCEIRSRDEPPAAVAALWSSISKTADLKTDCSAAAPSSSSSFVLCGAV